MSKELLNLINEAKQIADDARKTFGHLSAEQVNWKPSAESWSVGQCFEHLIKSNEAFYEEFEKLKKGERKNSFWENWSPFTKFFGNFLIKSLKSDKKKFKAPSKAIVPPSSVAANIIEQFAEHQAKVMEKIKTTENADWNKTVVTSPFIKLMTYSLSDAYQIMIEHEKRHFRQALRVTEMSEFPNNEIGNRQSTVGNA